MCSVARWRALPRRCGDLLDVEPERERLVCWPKSPLHNSSVIPGKLAIASDPESRKIANLDAGFLRHDDMRPSDLFCELLGRDARSDGENDFAHEVLMHSAGGVVLILR
jgi:hypothetical protein